MYMHSAETLTIIVRLHCAVLRALYDSKRGWSGLWRPNPQMTTAQSVWCVLSSAQFPTTLAFRIFGRPGDIFPRHCVAHVDRSSEKCTGVADVGAGYSPSPGPIA